MHLSGKFEEALVYAMHLHAGQLRNGSDVPCVAHLLGVAGLVLEHGGDEEDAIAALLHESAEEMGGRGRLEDIRLRFGEVVAQIVEDCTDTFERTKPAWRARKAAYIGRIPKFGSRTTLVSLADHLETARTIARDLRHQGEKVWPRIEGGKDGTLWFYRCLLRASRTTSENPMLDELSDAVKEIERLCQASEQPTPAENAVTRRAA